MGFSLSVVLPPLLCLLEESVERETTHVNEASSRLSFNLWLPSITSAQVGDRQEAKTMAGKNWKHSLPLLVRLLNVNTELRHIWLLCEMVN